MAWLVVLIRAIIDALQPTVPPAPPIIPTEPDYLGLLCAGIQSFEGWYVGSRSWRNRNPGNCRYSSVGYLPMYGNVTKDSSGFAIFPTKELGMLYLRNLILEKAKAHPTWSLASFLSNYAPSSDHNDPAKYASVVAKSMGVNQFTFTLRELL